MRYDCLKEFRDEEFRRLTGIKRTTFEKMVHIRPLSKFIAPAPGCRFPQGD
jgi:hypothetical protein